MKLASLLPLISAFVAFVLGWAAGGGQYLVWLLPLAGLNAAVVAQFRIKQARSEQRATTPNMVSEGAYLLVLQLLILGLAYLLGFFFANAVPLLSLR